MTAPISEDLTLDELQIVLNNLYLYGVDQFDIAFRDKHENKIYISAELPEGYVVLDLSRIHNKFFNKSVQQNVLIKSGILKLPFVDKIKEAIKFEDIESFRPIALAFDTNIFYLRLVTQHILRTHPLNKYDPTKLLMFYSHYVGHEIQRKLDNLKINIKRSKKPDAKFNIQRDMAISIIAAIELNELIHKRKCIQRVAFEIDESRRDMISIRRSEKGTDVYDNLIIESYKDLMKYRHYRVIFLTADQNNANAARLAGLDTIFIDQNDVSMKETFKISFSEFQQFLYVLTYTVLDLKISLIPVGSTLELITPKAAVTFSEPKIRAILKSNHKDLVESTKKDLETYRNVTGVLKK